MSLFGCKLLTDANIHPLVVQFLEQQGCDVQDVFSRRVGAGFMGPCPFRLHDDFQTPIVKAVSFSAVLLQLRAAFRLNRFDIHIASKPSMLRTTIACGSALLLITPAFADQHAFNVGFAKRDITPHAPTPMWGYGERHAMLSEGTADPLMAKAVVIEAAGDCLAIVGMDLGRGPTAAMIEQIRTAVAERQAWTM